MSQIAIPKFLLPRGSQYLRALQAAQLATITNTARRRYASSSSPSSAKPRVLEKPAKFNPPSHPSRLRSKPRAYAGPPLSEQQKQEQKVKQYPHMMPPEGTFMNWFLRDKSIHVWISMGVLITLALFVFVTDFVEKTSLKDLLPTRDDWKSHPFKSFRQFWSVYKLNVEQTSMENAERRRRQTEDVEKRRQYRKAHGIEERKLPFGLGAAEPEESAVGAEQNNLEASPIAASTSTQNVEETFADLEPKRKPVKKWLGIW
ncbi:MAG: hypothetical protein M1820_002400 [Bogoriella megaspora]|nr:MAG: hypothetical protein M1820_002400 [Bogoriella megaspora]